MCKASVRQNWYNLDFDANNIYENTFDLCPDSNTTIAQSHIKSNLL